MANRKGRMGLRQEGRGKKEKKEEGAPQPSFALGGTVSSTGENTFLPLLLLLLSTSDLRSLFVSGDRAALGLMS